jgi:hypothetical protein
MFIIQLIRVILNSSSQDFRLEFNYRSLRWMGAVATIVETHSCHLWGVVWIKNNDTITSLDE